MRVSLPWLDPVSLEFPDPSTALTTPNGLLAAGGDLSPARLLCAYQLGIFPWFSPGQPVLWWSPSPRMVLPAQDFKVSRSLRKTLRNQPWELSLDRSFSEVVTACAAPRWPQRPPRGASVGTSINTRAEYRPALSPRNTSSSTSRLCSSEYII